MTLIGWLHPHDDGSIIPGWLALAELGDEMELEDVIERAWLQRVLTPVRDRIKFSDATLRHYPLTQPEDICVRCERWFPVEGARWDLDHIVELQFGDIDHPANLVRLCRPCHKAKPYPPESSWGDPEAMRRFILGWIRAGPDGGVRAKWDWTE